ncbi:MAG: cytochrome c3 family protein [Candidatus Methanoperedens sp.]|nr:cytochrome c3 family protein [Candidatus Methanoperedens sp.]MCZ7394712.1 cytochrome c3 family protein [Candidatus Methanoperedens sp.]
MKYQTVAGLVVIWLVLATGLAEAGTLTVSLSPSLDGNGTIKAASITKAVLSSIDGALPDGSFVVSSGGYGIKFNTSYKNATIINGTAKFNLSTGDVSSGYYSGSQLEGASVMRINDLNDDLIPTRIDDPTKDIHQYVGEKLRVSVIGNLSDPTYRIETFSKGQGKNPVVKCTDGTGVIFDSIYIIISLKTNPQELEIKAIRDGLEMSQPGNFSGNILIISAERITNFTPTAPTHPSTSTAINPLFSKWVFGHGDDYGGNDSKCSNCHGNLDTKPASFSEITVNNGFCFRCHNGKGGADAGFAGQVGCMHPYPPPPELMITPTPTVTPTAIPTTATPKTSAFEALSAIAALLSVLLIKRK